MTALVLVSNQLVPTVDTEALKAEATYNHLSKAVAERVDRNQKLTDNINRITAMIRDNHLQELAKVYDEVATQLDEAAVGLETSAPLQEPREAESKDEPFKLSERTTRDHCRKLWRKLAAKLHPDRGGSSELFDMARQAYRNNDLGTLMAMTREYIDVKNIAWLKEHGINYLRERIESLDHTYEEIRNSPYMEAYTLWIAGAKTQAVFKVREILAHQIFNMQVQVEELHRQRREQLRAKADELEAKLRGKAPPSTKGMFDDVELDEMWADAHEVDNSLPDDWGQDDDADAEDDPADWIDVREVQEPQTEKATNPPPRQFWRFRR